MSMTGLTLLVPAKSDAERDAVASAWEKAGGTVRRLERFWQPPRLDASTTRVYGSDGFCLVLAEVLKLDLYSPADDLIFQVPPDWLKRSIGRSSLAAAEAISYPAFVKPLVPKQFRAGVYASVEDLNEECAGLSPETAILVSAVVDFAVEARFFALDGEVLAGAFYAGAEDLKPAAVAASAIVQAVGGPRAVVVDVGLIPGQGWAIVEFNPVWGAGLNGCDPQEVLPAILHASGPGRAIYDPGETDP